VIVCPSCGNQNADDAEFCASCRAYLGWDGERSPAPQPAAVPAPSLADTGRPATLEAAHPPAAEPVRVAPTLPAAISPAAIPPAPIPPAAIPPAPVQPAAELHAPPPAVPQPARQRLTDAVYCTACGADNEASRRFCRSCGEALVHRTPVRPPWWRRMFRRPAGPAAGERPGRRRRARARRGRRAVRGTVAAVLAVAVALLVFPGRHLVISAYDRVKAVIVTGYDPVKPVSATASSAVKGGEPGKAIDGVKSTAWAEGRPGLGNNQWLKIQLGRKVDLARIGITPGASDNEKVFRSTSRPADIQLVFSDGTEQQVSLRDEAAFQTFELSAKGVQWVRLDVLSSYRGQTGKQDTSIAEVEFFTRK